MGNVIGGVPGGVAWVKARRSLPRVLFGFAALGMVLMLPGCATYSLSVSQVETATANRDLDGAIKTLDSLKLSGADETLQQLNKGTLLRLQ